MQKWSSWKKMPSPENCRQIEGPEGLGLYQLKNTKTNENILFGISNTCRRRMKSLFPAPYGSGIRNNAHKRAYILKYWKYISYRTCETVSRQEAKSMEDEIKARQNHIFNT